MNSKNTITNAQALEQAIALATEAGRDELAAKLTKMHEVATKPRKRTKTESKASLQLTAQAKELAGILPAEPITTKWIMEHVPYALTVQKATGIANRAIALGLLVKGDVVNGKVTYKAA